MKLIGAILFIFLFVISCNLDKRQRVEYYSNGVLRFIGTENLQNKLNGTAYWYGKNGELQCGATYREDHLHGFSFMKTDDEITCGYFYNDYRNGMWITSKKNGSKSLETYFKGQYFGRQIEIDSLGNLTTLSYWSNDTNDYFVEFKNKRRLGHVGYAIPSFNKDTIGTTDSLVMTLLIKGWLDAKTKGINLYEFKCNGTKVNASVKKLNDSVFYVSFNRPKSGPNIFSSKIKWLRQFNDTILPCSIKTTQYVFVK